MVLTLVARTNPCDGCSARKGTWTLGEQKEGITEEESWERGLKGWVRVHQAEEFPENFHASATFRLP